MECLAASRSNPTIISIIYSSILSVRPHSIHFFFVACVSTDPFLYILYYNTSANLVRRAYSKHTKKKHAKNNLRFYIYILHTIKHVQRFYLATAYLISRTRGHYYSFSAHIFICFYI